MKSLLQARNEMEIQAVQLALDEFAIGKLPVHSRQYELAHRKWMARRLKFESEFAQNDTDVYNAIP